MTKTRWIIFAALCLLVLGGIVVLAQRNKAVVDDIDPAKVITDGEYPDHVRGKADSQVVLIEYGDYQCPACASVSAPLTAIVNQYSDNIAFVFRNLPLTSIHPNALAAAAAAEAAAKQGKYWEMNAKLYDNQTAWSAASADQRQSFFDTYASEIGLNIDQFKADFSSDEITRRINRDRALAGKIDANSTPTIVLNGETLDNEIINDLSSNGGEKLRELLDNKIREHGGTPPARTE